MDKFELENTLKPKIFIRIRPVEGKNIKAIKINENNNTVQVKSKNKHISWEIVTSGIFLNKSQQEIYNSTINGIFESIPKRLNAIILTYGQTGSGKSLTINGLLNKPLDMGILPRLVADLFTLSLENYKITLEMSIVELHNGFLVDLLENSGNMSTNYKRVKIVDEFQALKFLYLAEARKEFIENENYFSNLYTSVVTFYITFKSTHLTIPDIFTSKIHAVDMAGVDTIGNSTCSNKNSKQIGIGNCTKTFFEQFLILTANKTNINRIWFKLHPLVSYLKDELQANSLLRFIGHIYEDDQNLPISTSILKFSQVLGQIKPRVVANDQKTNESKLLQLENEVKKLREEQILNKILLNQYECNNLSNERVEQIQRTITQYLDNKSDELDLLETADIKNLLKIFRDMFNNDRKTEDKNPKTRGKVSKSEQSVSSKRTISIQSLSRTNRTSLSNNRKSTTKNRVSNASITTITSHKNSVQEHQIPPQLIPDYLPEYQEAWLAFTQDKSTSFKCLLNEYVENETNIRTLYTGYLNEIDRLSDLRKENEKQRHKLDEVSILLRFDTRVNCDYLKRVEENLSNQLRINEKEMLEQQENVLKSQTDLKNHLNQRQEIKNRIKNDFNEYSKRKFSTIVPDSQDDQLKDFTFDLNGKLSENPDLVDNLTEFHCTNDDLTQRHAKLKHIFFTELKNKKITLMKKHRKWVNT